MTVLPDSAAGSSSGAARPPRRPRRRTAGRWLGRALLGAAAFLVLAAVVLRIYLSDERLRRLASAHVTERSGAPTEIAGLQVSFLTGVELTGVRVGAMPGFTRDLLTLDRFALRWSLWELLRLRVVVREIALERPRLAIEQTDRGRNLDLFLAALSRSGGATAERTPSPPRPAPTSPAGPPEISLPLRVEVQRIALVDLAVDGLAPGLAAHVDHLHVEGRFAGQGKELELDLWAGLGERHGDQSAHVRLVRQAPAIGIDADVRLGIHATSHGLDDLALTIDLASRAHIAEATAWPVVEATGRLRATADLLAQSARVDECAFRLGQATTLALRAAAADLFRDGLAARVDHFAVDVDLDELAPLIAAAAPGLRTGGRLAMTIAPFEAVLTELDRGALPALTAALRLDDLRLQRPDVGIEGLDGRIDLATAGELASLEAAIAATAVTAAGQGARRVSLTLRATTPITAILHREAGDIEAQLELEAGRVDASAVAARDLNMTLDLTTPVGLLTAKPDGAPIMAGLRLEVGMLETATASATRTHLALDARLWDLAGDRLDAALELRIGGATTRFESNAIEIPAVVFTTDVARQGDAFAIGRLHLGVGDLVEVEARGGVTGAAAAVPRIRELAVRASVPQLAAVLVRLPAPLRPDAEIGGALHADIAVDGAFDRAELALLAAPPAVSLAAGRNTWDEAVRAYVGFIERWAALFARGLPATAALGVHLADVSWRDAASDVRGADADLTLEIGRHGPRVDLAFAADEVSRPAAVRGARVTFAASATGEGIDVRLDAGADEAEKGSGQPPLEKAAVTLRAHYRLGGDLVLEELAAREASLGLRVAVGGVLTRPLALVLARGWERPAMPGVELGLRFALGFGKAGQTATLATDGTAAGVIGIEGQLRIDQGLITLAGELAADGFSYVSGATAIEEMSGKLPFDLRLIAGQREDAAIVARDIGFGGGVLSLVAAADDIRSRPARPAYYDRLRSYREQRGIAIQAVRQDPYELLDLRLDGRIEQGMLLVDWLSMHVLGGDLVGNLALQLASDASVRGDVALQLSGIDASNFKLLELTPGPDSELNADLKLAFLFAPHQRDLTVNMNVTKIGAQTLDRFLQLLAAGSADDKLLETRRNLRWVRIDGVALWIRYESLNMDLAYSTRLRIPFTNIGYRPIDREMLRRYSLSGLLDTYLQPYLDAYLASALGWRHAR